MNTILISIIAIPIIEILLFIKVGENIGAINTILLIIFTAVIGVYFARIQGIMTLKSGFTNLYHNKMPIYEIFSGASIALAAIFLIIPGFFTDAIGFLLLIPLTRRLMLAPIMKKNKNQNKQDKTIEAEIIDEKKDEL
ncbi:FxsA family protein [Pelagibacteraceae bacterium]|nr:FxsA family protein [Pelagibacteraceae bacterium]MDC3152131.1 FxsA family protein [Pelagibacteraceae bacterium]